MLPDCHHLHGVVVYCRIADYYGRVRLESAVVRYTNDVVRIAGSAVATPDTAPDTNFRQHLNLSTPFLRRSASLTYGDSLPDDFHSLSFVVDVDRLVDWAYSEPPTSHTC